MVAKQRSTTTDKANGERPSVELHGRLHPSLVQDRPSIKRYAVTPFLYRNLKHHHPSTTGAHLHRLSLTIMGSRLTAAAVVLLLFLSLLFEVSAVVRDNVNNNDNKIKINVNEDIVESGLAGWLSSAKAIISSLLSGGAGQAPREKGTARSSTFHILVIDFHILVHFSIYETSHNLFSFASLSLSQQDL